GVAGANGVEYKCAMPLLPERQSSTSPPGTCVSRRAFVTGAAAALAAAPVVASTREPSPPPPPAAAPTQTGSQPAAIPLRIGMTDWNLGQRGDITKVALARQIGLDGIQVSLQFPEDGSLHLRDRKVQAAFKQAARGAGIQGCSPA